MVSSNLISLIHTSTVIQRWNDHIRPFAGFSEIDKQAHKTFYAYALAKCEKDVGGEVDFNKLIEGIIFEFLHRVIITDIKPPVYHKMKSEMGEEINSWVLSELEKDLLPVKGGLFDRMEKYFFDDNYSKKEKIIIEYAHYLATKWEFDIIYPMNKTMYKIEKTKKEVYDSLSTCEDFWGKEYFIQNPEISDFLNLIGQLRFQQRWTATARMPETSVMGHTFVVAILSYLFSLELESCPKKAQNAFFGGLFHDLPEVLTRDIISPVKRGIDGLDKIIKTIEDNKMHEVVYPLVPKTWHEELMYYTTDEFEARIINKGEIEVVPPKALLSTYNKDEFNPIDGKLIRICDHLSAYLEAYLSIKNGVEAEPLKNAISTLYKLYKGVKIANIDFGSYFKEFKKLSRCK